MTSTTAQTVRDAMDAAQGVQTVQSLPLAHPVGFVVALLVGVTIVAALVAVAVVSHRADLRRGHAADRAAGA